MVIDLNKVGKLLEKLGLKLEKEAKTKKKVVK